MPTVGTTSRRVGEAARSVREAKDLSTRDIGRALGRSHTWIVEREAGNRAITVDDLVALAEALDVSPRTLLP